MINFLISMFLVLPVSSGLETTCPSPTNVHVVSKNGGTITFDWNDCGCVLNDYKVKFTRISDSYTSPEYSAGTSDYTYSSLPSGSYVFYFWTECESESSEAIVIEDVIEN